MNSSKDPSINKIKIRNIFIKIKSNNFVKIVTKMQQKINKLSNSNYYLFWLQRMK
jgi:hypothetical protein